MNFSNLFPVLLQNPAPLFLLLFTMVCSFRDLRTGKIPNSFILCGLLCGLASLLLYARYTASALSALPRQGSALISAGSLQIPPDRPFQGLLGFLVPIILLSLFVLLRMIGGGDVKLLAVIGLFTGPSDILKIFSGSIMIGGIYSCFLLLARGNLFSRFYYLNTYVQNTVSLLRTGSAAGADIRAAPAGRETDACDTEKPPVLPPSYRGSGTKDGEFCFSVPIFLSLALFMVTRSMGL